MSHARFLFERRIIQLKRRLVREASLAIGMLEAALDALWRLDSAAAKEVRGTDDRVDREEVQIEQECYNLLALQQPFARDFRVITFILKVNSDIERVADHAVSIAKVSMKLAAVFPPGVQPKWPTSLTELGHRVPVMCHDLMRAVLNEDAEAARRLAQEDEVIDQLEKRLFEEAIELMQAEGASQESLTVGMLTYRLGRELERVGDLMKNVAEDVVYLATGAIVRHEGKKSRLSSGTQG